MLELEKRLGNVVGHVEIDGVCVVVPIDVYSTKQGAFPIHNDRVMFFKAVFQVDNVFACGAFYTKIINNETKHYVTPNMLPETGSAKQRQKDQCALIDCN